MRSKAVLEQYGFEVVNAQCLPDVKCIFDEPPRRVYGLIRSVDRLEADAVFISGVGLPTLSVLGQAERDLGKPVLSSACAMLWNALGTAGIATPVPGCGRLLEDARHRPASSWRPVRAPGITPA
jgi:maleate cis-trans isomerase